MIKITQLELSKLKGYDVREIIIINLIDKDDMVQLKIDN